MKPENTDQYIAGFPPEIREKLEQMRHIIHSEAPEAEECISYGMPAFRTKKVLVYFAAFKEHIGFFPTSAGVAAFTDKLQGFDYSKGAIRFYYKNPIPEALVREIVQYRLQSVQNNITRKSRGA